jgi:hypothetical protein
LSGWYGFAGCCAAALAATRVSERIKRTIRIESTARPKIRK